LIKNNELKLAHDLLPLVEHPETTTITLIEGWLEHADPLIVSYAALLLAESGRLTPKIVPHLIDFLTGNEDRSRYRAAIVLYGKDYLFSTSGVDTETVDVLMQTQLDYKQDNPRVAIAITWFFEQLIHDSAEAIEIWINRLKEGKNVEVASKILSHINSITPTAWRAFVSGLNDSNHEVQKALLKSVCRLIYLNNRNVSGGFPDDAWQTLAEIIPQMDEEVLADCSTPPFEPSKIVEALSIALSNSNDDSVSDSEIIKSATTIHKNFSLRLSDAVGKTQEKLREQIFQIGKSYFISVDYWKNATDAALKVKEKPELLPLLLQWFLTTLDEDKNDIFVYYKTTDILSVLSYTAQYMPAAFASKTDPSLSILEKSLIDIVKYYNSFPARSSAMYLLSYLRWVTADVVQALTDANRDVSYVQQAAIEAVVQFRHIDGDILPVLFENLSSPSASLAYATVQMLTTIGLDEQTSSEQRKSILANLAEAIREPLSKREIYLLTSSFNNSTITYVGTLNQVFYKVLLQISGSV
jgi:HEAT repeat protein